MIILLIIMLFHDTSPYFGDNFHCYLDRVASVCNNGDVKFIFVVYFFVLLLHTFCPDFI